MNEIEQAKRVETIASTIACMSDVAAHEQPALVCNQVRLGLGIQADVADMTAEQRAEYLQMVRDITDDLNGRAALLHELSRSSCELAAVTVSEVRSPYFVE
ncbi:hypothetical protein KA047_00760 [Candidatus Saccharibacteria bacterium]|nr:hypothetical protein [Candidatus Saccharibacteria bacterium]